MDSFSIWRPQGIAPAVDFTLARAGFTHSSRTAAARRLSLGFFRRLVTPPEQREVIEGCRLLLHGRRREARACFDRTVQLADGAFLAGYLALEAGDLGRAATLLEFARDHHRQLGACFRRHRIEATLEVALADDLSVQIRPGLRGALLGLCEAYLGQGRLPDALRTLESLRSLTPEDPVVRLWLCEALLEADSGPVALRRAVRLSEGTVTEGQIGTALMLYHARALLRLGLPEAARETLNLALRRRRGLSGGLQRALRYERVLVYERLGRGRRARADLERLHAEDPAYLDVAERLAVATRAATRSPAAHREGGAHRPGSQGGDS